MSRRIFIIDDDRMMMDCVVRAIKTCPEVTQCYKFTNIIEAMSALEEQIPDLIIMDIMLNGPNGLSLLNELSSYPDTNQIPVIIMTYLDLKTTDLAQYQVVKVLSKETMTPSKIAAAVSQVWSSQDSVPIRSAFESSLSRG